MCFTRLFYVTFYGGNEVQFVAMILINKGQCLLLELFGG